ncbi:hypothetical protein NQ314_012171 [Rhamnusium bicolor]|uniref:Serine hydrolase domain-containing protein n=1 Tax=Rhamnusium bicolor TaxID=1586634 RepID=A0AAV8XCT0_9CUCU|nr:hypothetical protein NQ314_012171 [Rhamnusium bicolor]
MENSENEIRKCCVGENMSQKLKILAIHGYRQNAETFRAKTGSFRKMVHKWAQFTYITAPHKVILVDDSNDLNKGDEPDIGQSKDEEQYGWFFNRDDKTFRGIRKGGPAIGFEHSLKLVETVFEEDGPFDGILGFSQGACFVGLLCDLQQRGSLSNCFEEPVVVKHPGGHYLPASSAQKHEYQKFFKLQQLQKQYGEQSVEKIGDI